MNSSRCSTYDAIIFRIHLYGVIHDRTTNEYYEIMALQTIIHLLSRTRILCASLKERFMLAYVMCRCHHRHRMQFRRRAVLLFCIDRLFYISITRSKLILTFGPSRFVCIQISSQTKRIERKTIEKDEVDVFRPHYFLSLCTNFK